MSTGKVAPLRDNLEQNSVNVQSVRQSPHQAVGLSTDPEALPAATTDNTLPPNPQPGEAQIEPIKVYYPRKHLCEAYVLWFPLGILGAHHFYLRRYAFGFLYFSTLGLCGVGWLLDLYRMPQLVKDCNLKMEHPEIDYPLNVFDAYAMWFPFGIFGLHHFYMGRINWGILYSWTAGMFGIGWLIDLVRIPSLVRQANIDLPAQRLAENQPRNADLTTAYLLGFTPVGIFGTHHFYMGQWRYGLFYLYTMGGAGIGWIVDWFRMVVLVKRVNDPSKYPLGNKQKHVDSAYVCAVPFGLFGGHHFYLGNNTMGTVYAFTLGLFAVGWLVDLARMPYLVKDANNRLMREKEKIEDIRRRLGIGPTITVPNRSTNQRDIFTTMPFGQMQQTNIEMTETPVLQPPSYSEAVAQSYQPSTSVQSYPQSGLDRAEGGLVNETDIPIESKEKGTKL